MVRPCLVLPLLIVCSLSSAVAAVLTVPDDYPSIQGTIDAAGPGDTVRIRQGAYTERLVLKDGVTLEGTDRDAVIVQCGGREGSALSAVGLGSGTVRGVTFQHTPLAEEDRSAWFPFPVVSLMGSNTRLEDCTIRNGVDIGVLVHGGAPTIQGCLSENNGSTGIFCLDAVTHLTVADSIVRGNKASGMALHGDGMEAMIRDNVMEHNGRFGINRGKGVRLKGKNNDFTDNGEINYWETRQLLAFNEFHFLEAMARHLREEKRRFSSGEWELDYFYDWLAQGTRKMEPEEVEAFLNKIELWKKEYPDSLTWRVVLAKAYMNRAWGYRGGGWASEVSQEGWQGYHEYMEKAWGVFDEAQSLPEKDPEYYATLASLTMEAPRRPSSTPTTLIGVVIRMFMPFGSRDQEKTPFLKGVKIEPLYYPLYYERTRDLLPRWGGSVKEMVKFADRSAQDTKDIAGESLYAVIASQVSTWEAEEDFKEHYQFSWSRIQQGYDEILEAFPDSYWRLSLYTRMACIYRDRGKAAELFRRLDGYCDEDVWGNRHRFGAHEAWALNNAPYPSASGLEKAVVNGDHDELARLLDTGADPNATNVDGVSMLMLAVWYDDTWAVERLLKAGADPDYKDPDEEFAIRKALNKRTSEMLRLLLRYDANPNLLDSYQYTPLMLAIEWGHPEYAELLLTAGADPNAGTEAGTSALKKAIQKGQRYLVRPLLDHGADPNAVFESQSTALADAAEREDRELCELLLEHGADVNLGNENGWTPLFTAADKGNLDLAKLFVEHGADVNAVETESGKMALRYAIDGGYEEIAAVLRAHGAGE